MMMRGALLTKFVHELPRWGIVACIVITVLLIGDLASMTVALPPTLGVTAEIRESVLVLRRVDPAGLGWDVGLRPGDRVLTVDGHAASGSDLVAVPIARTIAVRGPGGATLIASTNGAVATSRVRERSFTLLAGWFVIVGGVTFLLAWDRVAASILLCGATSAAVALVAALATPFGAPWSLAVVFVALNCFGVALLLFFLRFPSDYLGRRIGAGAAWACTLLHALILVAYCWTVVVAPESYPWVVGAWQFAFLSEILASCAIAIATWWIGDTAHAEIRGPLAVVALGLILGTVPFGLLTLLPPLLDVARPIPADVAVLTMAILPTGFAFALLSRRFLGITRLVRRGLIALVAWLGLLIPVAVVLDAARAHLGEKNTPLAVVLGSTLTLGACFAGLFPFAQRALRCGIERRLFHDQYDPVATLRQFGASLVGFNSGDVHALGAQIVDRLATTLDLSWCSLALRDDEGVAYRWQHGLAPVECALAGEGREIIVTMPLIGDSVEIGTLALGPKRHDVELLPDDTVFIATLIPLMVTAFLSACRARQLAAKVATLGERERMLSALNERLLGAQEDERRRIALEIHDDPLQRATLLVRSLDSAPSAAIPPAARAAAAEIGSALRAICAGLRPPVLDDLGLPEALHWLADETGARTEEDMAIVVSIDPTAVARLDPAIEAALFRVAQEALNNILKHAEASLVEVTLARKRGLLELVVVDNGRGFGAQLDSDINESSRHLGLAGMRERLRPWGGMVTVLSPCVGGVQVRAVVPVEEGDG